KDINEFQTFHSIAGFLQFVSPNTEIRKASMKCDLLLTNYTNELNLRKDIYKRLLSFKESKNNKLDKEDQFFIDKLILNYERNGINLDKDERDLLLKIKDEITKLEGGIANYICLAERNVMEFTKAELAGIPQNILINLVNKNDNDKYLVKTNKYNYSICMKWITDERVRERIEVYYSNMFSPTSLIYLAKLLVLRDKHAKLLSYKCHSDYKAFIQMTKVSDNIKSFMDNLLIKLNFRYVKEIETIRKISNNKKELFTHDIQYYLNKWKEQYGINENSLKEYFEYDKTINEIFKIYEKLFSIVFRKIETKNKWHPSVTLYEIIDTKDKKAIGKLYLDVFNRDSKYRQTRCFCLDEMTVVLVASIGTGQVDNKKTLLNFTDTISLFHELTHVMHHIFGKTKYPVFNGLNVEIDFVETPAQIIELLCWEKPIIRQLSCHYKTGKSLDNLVIDKLVKLKNLDIALHYKKSILISLFDQIIYSSSEIIEAIEDILKRKEDNIIAEDLHKLITNLYRQLNSEIMIDSDKNNKYKIKLNDKVAIPYEWLNTFLGSESQHYCSTWSRVLAADTYREKIKGKGGEINSEIGRELIDKILRHGGTKPGYEMICDYIGRIPTIDGFISMHELDTNIEFSFFLNTDQINNEKTRSPLQNKLEKEVNVINKKELLSKDKESDKNKQTENYETEANKFSEINECVYISDIESQTEAF
ncbi:MAG: peptidase, partial [Barrevirus sp.]